MHIVFKDGNTMQKDLLKFAAFKNKEGKGTFMYTYTEVTPKVKHILDPEVTHQCGACYTKIPSKKVSKHDCSLTEPKDVYKYFALTNEGKSKVHLFCPLCPFSKLETLVDARNLLHIIAYYCHFVTHHGYLALKAIGLRLEYILYAIAYYHDVLFKT